MDLLSQVIKNAGDYILDRYKPLGERYGIVQEYPHSLRYTPRHGSKLAANLFRYDLDRPDLADRLENLLKDFGFNQDIYDVLWGLSNDYPDNFLTQVRSFHDVDVYDSLPRGNGYYPYKSGISARIGKIELRWFWRKIVFPRDPLYYALYAIHLLNKYGLVRIIEARNYLDKICFDGRGIRGKGLAKLYLSGNSYDTLRLAVLLAGEVYWAKKVNRDWKQADEIARVLTKLQYKERDGSGHLGGFYIGYKLSNLGEAIPTHSRMIDLIRDTLRNSRFLRQMSLEMPRSLIPTNTEVTAISLKSLMLYKNLREG